MAENKDNSMVIGGVDFSLPYDEYVANFRKKYPRAQPMSEYNYNLFREKALRNAKATGATKEELDDAKATGALNTPEVQEAKATGALNTPEVQEATDAGALNTPEVQEATDAGTKKADETVLDSTNREVADSVSEAVTPKKDDPQTVINSKNNYNKAMMSIWDAYRNKLIDKETAGYFTIDAIATLAKNLGRSIGNVGAQFSGGTIDNGHDESKWGQRQNDLLNEAIGKETENLGGAAGRKAESETLDNEAKKIRNAYTPEQLEQQIETLKKDVEAKKIRNAYTPKQLEQQIEMFKKDLEMADINLDMAHSKTDLINFIKKDPDYAKSPFKMGLVAYLTQAGAAGAVNNTSKTLGDAINWMLTLVK